MTLVRLLKRKSKKGFYFSILVKYEKNESEKLLTNLKPELLTNLTNIKHKLLRNLCFPVDLEIYIYYFS